MRARNLKPGFFDNENLADCGIYAMVLFEGLWCYADRKGRFVWRPRRIKAKIFPYFEGVDIDEELEKLMRRGFIIQYTVNGEVYGWIPTFRNHQSPHQNEKPSKIPPPPNQSTESFEEFHEMSRNGQKVSCNAPNHSRHSDYAKSGYQNGDYKDQCSPDEQQQPPNEPPPVDGPIEHDNKGCGPFHEISRNSRKCLPDSLNPDSLIGDNITPGQSDKDHSAPEPPEPVISIPLNDGTEFHVTEEMVQELQSLYPAVDTMIHLKKIRGWNLGNYQNRKTRRGIKKHIYGWFARAQDKAPRVQNRSPPPEDTDPQCKNCGIISQQIGIDETGLCNSCRWEQGGDDFGTNKGNG